MTSSSIFVPYKYRDGGVHMSPIPMYDPEHQVFNFHSDDGKIFHYHVGELIRICKKKRFPTRQFEVTKTQAEFFIQHNGVGNTIDVRWGNRGFGFFNVTKDKFYLVRCGACGKENYMPNVATGICTWCGDDPAKTLKKELPE